MPLELVLLRLSGTDIDRLRSRVQAAADLKDSPVAAREWAHALSSIMLPVFDRLIEAERRAALAEAQVEILRRDALA